MLLDWQNVRGVLVMQVGSRQDLMQTIPALQRLRQLLPNAAITLMVSFDSSQMGLQMPWVDDLLVYEGVDAKFVNAECELALISKLHQCAFDAAVIFTNALESPYPLAYICYLAGIPIRIGQSQEFGGGLLSEWVKPQPKEQSTIDQHLFLLESAFPTYRRSGGTSLLHRPLRILTWHIHGSYLYYLTQSHHQFYLPIKLGRPEGYGGRNGNFPWSDNVHDVLAEEVRNLQFDCILFQSRKNYLEDQYDILSESQRRLPQIYLEHDPPREHPTDTHHIVDDPDVLLVHVTQFNQLMWDSNRTPTRVIEHGVMVTDGVRYTGELERGLVVVNGLRSRGRRLGVDVFERVRQEIPLDLVGMGAEQLGGLGEVPHDQLPAFASRYRFFFNPIRYTSLGLAVCEAMMVGLPIIGLATTEMVTVVENGVSGYVDTDIEKLISRMRQLLNDPTEAKKLSQGALLTAQKRFNIQRFSHNWNEAFKFVIGSKSFV